eukprot:3802670-Pyramimonas_sp.AAC.1
MGRTVEAIGALGLPWAPHRRRCLGNPIPPPIPSFVRCGHGRALLDHQIFWSAGGPSLHPPSDRIRSEP